MSLNINSYNRLRKKGKVSYLTYNGKFNKSSASDQYQELLDRQEELFQEKGEAILKIRTSLPSDQLHDELVDIDDELGQVARELRRREEFGMSELRRRQGMSSGEFIENDKDSVQEARTWVPTVAFLSWTTLSLVLSITVWTSIELFNHPMNQVEFNNLWDLFNLLMW